MPRTPITDLTVYASRPITDMMQDYAEWVSDQVGIDVTDKKSLRAFYLGATMRGQYQAAQRDAGGARTRAAVKQAQGARPTGPKTKAKDTSSDDDVRPAPRSGRAKAASKPTTAKPATKPASGRRGAPAKTSGKRGQAAATDAPF